MSCRPNLLCRRDFLRLLAGTAALSGFSRFTVASEAPVYPFSVVPPSASGITWTHTAGNSPEKYLPESTGAGCAFLDYDNDGWMDIYLVNSGRCDFFTPPRPLRNALYRYNRDGTFTDVTGTALKGEQLLTNGGRLLNVTGVADNIAAAWEKITDKIGRADQIALYKKSFES